MSCLNPVYIQREDKSFQAVRCRQCEDCKQMMRSSAFVRLKAEYEHCMKEKGMCFFFTLTFSDEYVPFKFRRMCFDKRYIQQWLQKFRQEFRRKYGYKVKYFIVSELGHVGTHRPHHHGMFFLYKDEKYMLKSWKEGKNKNKIPFFAASYARIIANLWEYGRVDISEFDSSKGGIQYVSKYMSKFDEEEKLFKDIITRIQIKRGKGQGEKAIKYYADTFPSLHAFMQRYCPFTMISQGLGSSLIICEKCLIEQKKLNYEGFEYSIPRYYSDRYIRQEIKSAQQFVYHDKDFSDCGKERRFVLRPYVLTPMVVNGSLRLVYHDEYHPIFPISNYKPSDKVCERYKVCDDLFNYHYEMPLYDRKSDGTFRQVFPKQSEVSQLSLKRKRFKALHLLDFIEDEYFNLPPILQDSCSFDVPRMLKDTPKNLDEFVLTHEGRDLLLELEELSRVASDWRARFRLAKMEQKRKDKIAMNKPYAKQPLSWEAYRGISKYFNKSLSL